MGLYFTRWLGYNHDSDSSRVQGVWSVVEKQEQTPSTERRTGLAMREFQVFPGKRNSDFNPLNHGEDEKEESYEYSKGEYHFARLLVQVSGHDDCLCNRV